MAQTMNFYQAMKHLKDNQGARIVCSTYPTTYYLMFNADNLYWYVQKSNEQNGQLQITKHILDATYTIYEPKNPNEMTFGELKAGEYFEYPRDTKVYRKLSTHYDVKAYLVPKPSAARFQDDWKVTRLPDYKE